jgi:hypothetical protein
VRRKNDWPSLPAFASADRKPLLFEPIWLQMWRKQGATGTTLGRAVIGPGTIGTMPARAMIPEMLLARPSDSAVDQRGIGHQSHDGQAGAVELFPQEITRAFLNLISNGFYAATRRKMPR